MAHIIAPSLLSADFANLQKDIERINSSEAGWFHVDIMDGVFVPNISFGFPVLKAIQKYALKPLDVHLMIANADPYLTMFRDAGAHTLTVHYEACTHLHRTVQAIKHLGMKAGVALNPHTPVQVLEHLIHELDLVLIMSVNPGFGGQTLIEHSYQKIKAAQHLITEAKSNALIEVDGGVTLDNASLLVRAGAQVLVAGNSVFGSKDPVDTIRKMAAVK